MKNHIIRFFTIACLLTMANGTKAGNTLFEIGRKDGKAAEFALSPNHYKNFLIDFTGVKHYAVGYSQSHKNWPYVLPGPKDNWAEEVTGPVFIHGISQSLIFSWIK